MLTTDKQQRKETPVCTGVLDYFPDALAAVAHCSKVGNDQHNPGQPLHWAKEKSTDHADCLVRHLMERGTMDTDGVSHTAKVAWRALSLLQTEIEQERENAERNATDSTYQATAYGIPCPSEGDYDWRFQKHSIVPAPNLLDWRTKAE
jgi:hypothetical protein